MVEGTAEFLFSSVGYRQAEEGQRDADEQLSGVAQEPDLEKIKANALARERILKVRSRLDEIRLERSAQLAARDTDATGVVRNGLFAWRAIRRSVKQTLTDVTKSASDLREAERDVDVSGVDNEHISSMISEAADGFSSLSGDQAKAEMNQLLSVIAERYQLDQEARQVHPVISKLKSLIESNSPAINIVIGSVFRIAFKGVTHTAGLGGAVLASAAYGAASKGIGEYRAARSELLGAKGWREALLQFENPKQKLEIMRQMIVDKEALKKYFAGNSSEAFEFFGQYQELLAQCDGIDSEELLKVRVSSIEDVYSQRKREIGSRAWRAAGRGAARAAVFSGIGYIGTHVFSELLHGDIAHAQTADSDLTAQGSAHVELPTAEPMHEGGENHGVVWRYHGDDPSHSARLEIDPKTGLFREADGQESLVKIEGDESTGDTGSTPEQVANIIAKQITHSYDGAHSLPIDLDQQQQIQDHIAKWLEEHKARDLENGEFRIDETVHVPASELNAALQEANVTGESIKEALGLSEMAGGTAGSPSESGGLPPEYVETEPIPPVSPDGGSAAPDDAGMSPTGQPVSPMPDTSHGVSENGTQPYSPNMAPPAGPVHEISPEGEQLRVPAGGAKAEANADHSHAGQVMGVVAGLAAAGLLVWGAKKVIDKRRGQQKQQRVPVPGDPTDPASASSQDPDQEGLSWPDIEDLRDEYESCVTELENDPDDQEKKDNYLNAAYEFARELLDVGHQDIILGDQIFLEESGRLEALEVCDRALQVAPGDCRFGIRAAVAVMSDWSQPDYNRAVSYLEAINLGSVRGYDWCRYRETYAFALLMRDGDGDAQLAFSMAKAQIDDEPDVYAYLLAAEAQFRIDPNSPLVDEYFEEARRGDPDSVTSALENGNFPSLAQWQDDLAMISEDLEEPPPPEHDGDYIDVDPMEPPLTGLADEVDAEDDDEGLMLPPIDGSEPGEAADVQSGGDSGQGEQKTRSTEGDAEDLTDRERAFRESLDRRLQPAFDKVMKGEFPALKLAKQLQNKIFDSATTPLWFVRRFGLVAHECPKNAENMFRTNSVASDCYWRLFSSPGDVESEEMAFAAQRCLEHSEFAIKYAKTNEDKEKYEQRIGECKKYLGEASQGDGNAPTTLSPPEPVVRAQSNTDSVDASQADATPSVEALSYSEKEFRDALPDGSREVFDGVLAGNLPDKLLGIIDLIATVHKDNVPFSFIKKLAPMVNDAAYVGKDKFAMHMLAADCYERIYQETIGTVSPEEKREAILRCAIHNGVLTQFSKQDIYSPKAEAAARLYIESGYQDPDLGRIKSILFDSLEAQSRTDEARAFALEIGSDPGAWGGVIPKKALEYIRENEAQQQGS